jgi:DNA-binding IclR family transcriptional regulator
MSGEGASAREAGGVAAVERALSILDAFDDRAGGDGGLALHEIAARTGLYKSTALRLLASLERFGHVRRTSDGRWRVGPAPLRLASLYKRSFRIADIVLPHLRAMAADLGESASFYVRDRDARLCLHRVDSPRSVRDAVREGDRLPLDRGAGGRVLLAFADGIAAARAAGPEGLVFVSRGERSAETAGVAAPVFGPDGALAGSVNFSGPVHRFDEEAAARMGERVRTVAADVTRQLGGDAGVYGTTDGTRGRAA